MSKKEDEPKKKQAWIPLLAILSLALTALSLILYGQSTRVKEKYRLVKDEQLRCDSLLKARNLEFIAWKEMAVMEGLNLQKETDTAQDESTTGIFFEVQIGSFVDFDLDEYVRDMEEIRQEKDSVSTKLLLGRFRSIRQARLFENDMKRIGLKDAFVIGRINGKLVDVDVAVEALMQQNNR